MKISFCTTCMGRAHHLKETLPANIAHNSDVETEFVVLDYNSKDDLQDWMHGVLSSSEAARVRYYRERTAKFFDPRHAKNVAHLLATGDVLVNLDADNFTGAGYAAKLVEMFTAQNNVFVATDFRIKSLTGKIAIRKSDFERLRGYDETFTGWGAEDPDLILRATRAGITSVRMRWPGERAIEHSDEDRIRNFDMGGLGRLQTDSRNWSRAKLRPSSEVINPSGFGLATVYVGLTGEVRAVGVPAQQVST